MDRWAVYEYVKNYYYRCGRIPTMNILVFEFPELPLEEIEEGLIEFELVLKRAGERFEPHGLHERVAERSAV